MHKVPFFFIAVIILETCLVIQSLPYPSGREKKESSLDAKEEVAESSGPIIQSLPYPSGEAAEIIQSLPYPSVIQSLLYPSEEVAESSGPKNVVDSCRTKWTKKMGIFSIGDEDMLPVYQSLLGAKTKTEESTKSTESKPSTSKTSDDKKK